MVQEREKLLLDFAYEKAKDIEEFIKQNGYTGEELTWTSLFVWPNHNGKGTYMRSELNVMWPSGNSKRYVEKLSIDGDTPGFIHLDWEDKE